jgi:GGDEF domain-containing protein
MPLIPPHQRLVFLTNVVEISPNFGIRDYGTGMKKLGITERRIDSEKRRRVAEMSRADMIRALLTSDLTGLPNRRAFEETGPAAAVAMCDVDGLKAFNDQYGYEAGDMLLRAMAVALREVGLEAYHDKGDEFLCRGTSIEELEDRLDQARAVLRDFIIVVERPHGTILRFTGADFSYGVGEDVEKAEHGLKSHKADRYARGELKRGELCGIVLAAALPPLPDRKSNLLLPLLP